MLAALALAALTQSPTELGSERVQAYRQAVGRCRAKRHCFPVRLNLWVGDEGAGHVEPEWVAESFEVARELFAPIEVDFEIAEVRAIGDWGHTVTTRRARDQLARDGLDPKRIDLFSVGHLMDVDRLGEEIRGVHWRVRGQAKVEPRPRLIIWSGISRNRVLAHELGHYFGLPHSSHPRSLMNKSPRSDPPWEERVFVEAERQIMLKARDRMLLEGRGKASRVLPPPVDPVVGAQDDAPPQAEPGK